MTKQRIENSQKSLYDTVCAYINGLKASGRVVVAETEVSAAVGCSKDAARRTMKLMCDRGILRRLRITTEKYEILQEPLPTQPKEKHIQGRDKMWRAMRAKRSFTKKDIARIAGVSRASADVFFHHLVKEGLLRKTGMEGRANLFMLARDAGVSRPKFSHWKKGEKGGEKRC